MKFIQKTIAPKGRNKYGNYQSSGNITKSVVSTTYAGNDTTTTISDTGTTEDTGTTNFYCMLSQTNVTFNGIDLVQGSTAATQVIAYKGYDKAVAYVCDMDAVSAVTREDGSIEELIAPANMGISGIPSGMSVSFSNNGTSASTIIFSANNLLTGNTGSIYIPVTVYKRSDDIPLPNDLYNWYDHAYQIISGETIEIVSTNNCEVVWLEYVWNVNRVATSNYVLDLSNQTAGVNCDSEGVLYPNSIATLKCTATTYYNGEAATGITYSAHTESFFGATGYSINTNTGVMSFNSGGTKFYWNNNYPSLPIDILAIKDGDAIATKTMTITRNYPGSEGQPAVTRWIEADKTFVRYNPNSNQYSESSVTGTVWKQVGSGMPETDAVTTIYQWYNNLSPISSAGTITAPIGPPHFDSVSSVTFALKNGNNEIYEQEDVVVIFEGKNGGTGPQGPQGPGGTNGTNGEDGKSAWYLTLDNDNASINADASGNIYTNAIRPTCHGKLYYGTTRQTNAEYQLDYGGATGIESGVSNGILTLNFTSAFTFNDDVLSIAVSGLSSGQVQDVKYMNVTKSRAGAAGTNGETPYIGSNGNWWIGNTDTGIKAEGDDGNTPYIGANGNWWIGNTDTGVKAEGLDAVTYWLELTTQDMIYDKNNNSVNPSTVSATAYKQVGEYAAAPATDAVITYKRVFRNTGVEELAVTSANSVTITPASAETYSIIRFRLYVDGTQRDMEDVGILMNGTDGTNGTSIQGPAVRGPYDYAQYSATTRCWCAGESGGSCTDCNRWIDVIMKNGVYYYCNTTYNNTIDYGFQQSHPYWTEGEKFDFIAAGLILASGGSINFLSNNVLFLMDENGNVTGGARGGSGYTFWAGQKEPENAPFRVNASGSVTATTGVIGGWYYDQNGLQWADTMSEVDYGAGLSDYGVWFTQGGMDNDLALIMTKEGGIYYGSNHVDARQGQGSSAYCIATLDIERENQRIVFSDGVSTISDEFRNTPGIHTNMAIYGHRNISHIDFNRSPIVGDLRIKTDVVIEGNPVKYVVSASGVTEFSTPVMNPFGFGMKMAVITSDISRWWVSAGTINGTFSQTSNSYFTAKQTDQYHHGWYFNNDLDMKVPVDYYSTDAGRWYSSYRYLVLTDSTCVNSNWKSLNDYGIPSEWVGMWCGYEGNSIGSSRPGNSARYYPTGIYGSNFTNKKGDTIYFSV